jgi:hypothetical protein
VVTGEDNLSPKIWPKVIAQTLLTEILGFRNRNGINVAYYIFQLSAAV